MRIVLLSRAGIVPEKQGERLPQGVVHFDHAVRPVIHQRQRPGQILVAEVARQVGEPRRARISVGSVVAACSRIRRLVFRRRRKLVRQGVDEVAQARQIAGAFGRRARPARAIRRRRAAHDAQEVVAEFRGLGVGDLLQGAAHAVVGQHLFIGGVEGQAVGRVGVVAAHAGRRCVGAGYAAHGHVFVVEQTARRHAGHACDERTSKKRMEQGPVRFVAGRRMDAMCECESHGCLFSRTRCYAASLRSW